MHQRRLFDDAWIVRRRHHLQGCEMTKIIINAKVLQQMLADQPEISIELAKNAADQVAEAFKKKVNTSVMANQMFQNLSEQLSYRHSPVSAAAHFQKLSAKLFAGRLWSLSIRYCLINPET